MCRYHEWAVRGFGIGGRTAAGGNDLLEVFAFFWTHDPIVRGCGGAWVAVAEPASLLPSCPSLGFGAGR